MELIDRILGRVAKPSTEPLPEPDANMALTALMIRVAKADHTYRVEEIAKIDRLISELFHLNPVEAAKMRATCEKLEAAAPHEGNFAKLIHDSLDEAKRFKALKALYAVMRADGVDHPEEEDVLRETGAALGFADLPMEKLRGG